jgi:F-type H+-transporting ATPase subunit gamma
MPSLIDIRRRIRSVKNTRQITKAMKMVSAAKLRRAQDRVIAARPYAESMHRLLANVAQAVADQNLGELHPLLARRPEEKIQILLITADRGLAGAFNANVIRAAQKFITDRPEARFKMELIGRKGRDFFARRANDITGQHTTLFQKNVNYEDAKNIAHQVIERYEKGEVDAVYIIVNHFKSVIAPQLKIEKILPVEPPEAKTHINYIYGDRPSDLLARLLPRYVEGQLFRAMLESAAAEHAARMTAMDAASSNAGEVIDKLTLNMNRVRQASITREIIEIVSGASALG